MKWKSSDLIVELEIMNLWSQQLIKKKSREVVWHIFLDIAYGIEEQRENVIYTKPKLKPWSVAFIYEYIMVKFILRSQFVTMSWT
jgi:hypothetical protein